MGNTKNKETIQNKSNNVSKILNLGGFKFDSKTEVLGKIEIVNDTKAKSSICSTITPDFCFEEDNFYYFEVK